MMERLKKLQQHIQTSGFDAFFVRSEQNITYLTGFKGDASRLVVAGDKAILITDGRYTEQARNECNAGVQVLNWKDDLRYHHYTYCQLMKELGVTKLIFEGDRISYAEFRQLEKCELLKLQSEEGIVESFRKVKSKDEIKCLKKAGQISDRALMRVQEIIKPGVSELDVVAELEYQLKKCGAHGLSFNTMVLFGERSSLLHGKPTSKKLKNGEHILFDYGAEYMGYHADISRLMVMGKADEVQKEIHNIVNSAGLSAMEILKDGVSVSDVDTLIRSHIPKKYTSHFYPGIGHGVGLEIHEQPFIKPNSGEYISEGMVITIEPGLYIPTWGGMREEDSILISKTSCESLNKFPRDLIQL